MADGRDSGVRASGVRASALPGIVTLPNLVTFGRMLSIPLFAWTVLVLDRPLVAFVILVVAGASDWWDGHVARRRGQVSPLGEVLDPLTDRLFIFVVALVLAAEGTVPWWVAAVLVVRDLMLWGLVPWLRTRGRRSLPVHFIGKAATFMLLTAFPLVLLADQPGAVGILGDLFGWAFVVWGMALYWWAGLIYVWQLLTLMQQVPPEVKVRVKTG